MQFVKYHAAGNDYLVYHDYQDRTTARKLGPIIEHLPLFPNRTNVQFVQVIDRRDEYNVLMQGPVCKVGRYWLDQECLAQIE